MKNKESVLIEKDSKLYVLTSRIQELENLLNTNNYSSCVVPKGMIEDKYNHFNDFTKENNPNEFKYSNENINMKTTTCTSYEYKTCTSSKLSNNTQYIHEIKIEQKNVF